MALNQFIPSVWSASLLRGLEKSLVFAQPGTVNTDYSGEIAAAGDRVHFHGFTDPTIIDYVKNTTVLSYEVLNDLRATLVVDSQKAFAVKVDDIDHAQQHPKIKDSIMDRAAYLLADTVDANVASRYTEALAGNVIATTQATAANVYSKFVGLAQRMDEANVPAEGRYAIIPPWVKALLLQDNTFATSAKPDAILNAELGQIAGMRLLVSNRVVTTGTAPVVSHIMAGVADAIGFAQQINEMEALRLESAFADGLRGLLTYGSKTLRPELLFVLRLNP